MKTDEVETETPKDEDTHLRTGANAIVGPQSGRKGDRVWAVLAARCFGRAGVGNECCQRKLTTDQVRELNVVDLRRVYEAIPLGLTSDPELERPAFAYSSVPP